MTAKKIGIWMDHEHAELTEFTECMETRTIDSAFTHPVKEESLSKGENAMHTKEQHQRAEHYKKLGEVIRNYDEVLLFGPTQAKNELLNILNQDPLFSKIKINVASADKMTENQKHAFVRNYFLKD